MTHMLQGGTNMEKFYIIKIWEKPFSNLIKGLKSDKANAAYNLANNDMDFKGEIKIDDKILFISFRVENSDISYLDAIACRVVDINDSLLTCKTEAFTDKKLIIENLCNMLLFDLQKDFKKNSYITEESAVEVYDNFVKEQNIKVESDFNEINSNDEYIRACKLQFDDGRSTYSRDRDRIIHSKAFRRMVDKAQIFTSSKGDHFRTRMTHTLEVTQIARTIAVLLNNEIGEICPVDETKTEAIALAHDIGHTPFGHVGERALNSILRGKTSIIKNTDIEGWNMGFKHNYQALRVLTSLEVKYPDIDGLNLTYEVMEGAWKHTKIKKHGDLLYSLDDFFLYPNSEYLYPEYDFPTTIEGQIVAIADEIAQRSHDVDDAFKANKLSFEELKKNSHIKKAKNLSIMLKQIEDSIKEAKNNNIFLIDENDMLRARLCSEIISFFVTDVVNNTLEKLNQFFETENEFFEQYKRFDQKIVDWSETAHNVSKFLEQIIATRVIISSEVTQFDTSSKRVIEKLFKYYYNNPLSLPDNTLRRVYISYMKKGLSYVNFKEGNVNIIRDELEKITQTDLNDLDIDERKEYLEKRKILVRCIADHIGGMTDSYAIQEYHKLYNL
ncbi:dNTP triphosphohydrolase [Absiella sp. AM54-8XD]|nr:dNTP triphosphohydrolase [Absiella sp. AM54-8XD]RGC51948.1 dNTP triphosphohydrolase [Absiella sp. AM29-15]